MEMDQISKNKKDVSDIVNSGLAQMDLENTYQK